MKYRIKIKTFRSGRIEYSAWVRNWGVWMALLSSGKINYIYPDTYSDKDKALEAVKNHRKGNGEVTIVEYLESLVDI